MTLPPIDGTTVVVLVIALVVIWRKPRFRTVIDFER